jgi:hypothetical protein
LNKLQIIFQFIVKSSFVYNTESGRFLLSTSWVFPCLGSWMYANSLSMNRYVDALAAIYYESSRHWTRQVATNIACTWHAKYRSSCTNLGFSVGVRDDGNIIQYRTDCSGNTLVVDNCLWSRRE